MPEASQDVDRLAEAIRLRRAGRRAESLAMLLELARRSPHDPAVSYQCAWAHDLLGKERQAIPFYRRALQDGLRKRDRPGAHLGLGSSYRCIGEYRKAETALRRGASEFPKDRALQVFLAMALFNRGRHDEAMEILLRNLVETSSDEGILAYRKAIAFYSDKLRKTWR